MKTSFLILLAAGLVLAGCGKSSSNPPNPPSPQTPGTNTAQTVTNKAEVANPSGGYLGALAQANKSARKTIDVSYLNQAVQLFNTQEGRYPKDLNELVPNYVAKLPPPPVGYQINYDAQSGLVTVVKQ
jgi:hypothetical protein